MEEVPDASKQLLRILKFYVDEFRQNQDFVKAHLKGISSNEPPLLPAFLPPSSYWTSAEKDLFFHALSIYSRLQPDLIAQHIKTKSIFDVCVYLEALQAAAVSVEQDNENEHRTLDSPMEPAMEVSEKWIQREESIAESLMGLDACPCSLESSTSKTCSCPSASEEVSQDHPISQKFGIDHLNHMDPACLVALEMINNEEGTENRPNDPQPLAEDSMDLQGGNFSQSDPEVASNVDQQVSRNSSPSPKPDKAQLRRIQKRLYMRRKRAEAIGKMANLEAVKLRPGRQARELKPAKPRSKTYKPRKTRSSGRGRKPLSRRDTSQNGDDNDDDKLNEDIRSPASTSRLPSHEQEDSEDEDNESDYGKRNRGGMTRPYRLKKLFYECGITAQTLSDMDLELFNFSALGKLLRLNNALNAPSRKRDAVSISVECTQLLKEMIKEFLSKVIQCVIIMKEQEIRLKASLKVWKYDQEEISAESVLECLKAMGLDQLRKERYFSSFLESDDDDSNEIAQESAEQSSEEDTSTSESPPTHSESSFSPHIPSYLTYCDLFSDGDSVLSDVDEAALTRELAEEEILDVLDTMRSKHYEKNLWKTHC